MSDRDPQNYDFVVRRRGGEFYVFVDELSVISQADDLESAWRDCERKCQSVVEAYARAGVLDRLPPSTQSRSAGHRARVDAASASTGLLGFLARVAIVLVAVFGLMGAGTWMASNALRSAADRFVAKTDGKSFWSKIEQEISRTANKSLDPQKEAQIRENLRKIVAQIKPFTDELAPLFAPEAGAEPR